MPVTGIYSGFDPTAKSLHIGNIVPVLGLILSGQSKIQPYALVKSLKSSFFAKLLDWKCYYFYRGSYWKERCQKYSHRSRNNSQFCYGERTD